MALPSIEVPLRGERSNRTRFSRGLEVAGRTVLVVAPQPFYQDRGTPIALRQVLQALSELGYRVDLLTFPVGGDIQLPGLRIIRAGNPTGIRSVPIGLSVPKLVLDGSLIAALRRQLAHESYTCVHALEEAAWPALALAHSHGVPLLYDMQSSLPEQLLKHKLAKVPSVPALLTAAERWLLRRADLVVASTGLADRVHRLAPDTALREWKFPSTPRDVPPSETAALRVKLGIPLDAPVVVYSGTFEQYQGLSTLAEAVPAVLARVPATRFVLVGADRTRGVSAIAGAEQLVCDGVLTIVDRQPRSAMPGYLAMADVLVSPRAFGGNLPLKIFDYLAAGRPIVATDISTHRSVLTDETAVLVATEAGAIAEGIVSVLTDPITSRDLSAAARQYALNHLGWSRFVRSVGQIYDEAHRRVPA